MKETGFKVETSGNDIAYSWLTVTDKAFKLPVNHPDLETNAPTLRLGSINTGDKLIETLGSMLSYSEIGRYQLKTQILPYQEPSQNGFSHPMIPGGLQQLLGGFNIMEVGSASSQREVPVNLLDIGSVLERRLISYGYQVEYGKNPSRPELLLVKHKEGDIDSTDAYTLGAIPSSPAGPFYFLDSPENKIDEGSEQFSQKYNLNGRLVEEVILAIYEAGNCKAPDITFKITPEEGTEDRVKQTEKVVELGRKQLSAMGYLDDGDDEDIQKNVVMERPDIRFIDVGGQEFAKTELSDVVAGLENPEEFRLEGAEPPTGILLYGPSGTGKTLLARATAGEADATIFNVGLSSILHSLWGKTERYIQRIFDLANKQAPAIIFLDEIDAIARQRSSLNQAYSSILNTILTNMDGMKEKSPNVIVIGATNLPDLIDEALLRPGRFDLLIKVDLPNESGRAQIFEIHKRKALLRAEKAAEKLGRPVAELFDPNFNINLLVSVTNGLNGADIEEILRRSLIERVRAKKRGLEIHPVTVEDMIRQVNLYEKIRKDKAHKAKERPMGFGGLTSRYQLGES